MQDSLRQIMEGLDGGPSQGQPRLWQQQKQQQGQHRAKGSSGAAAANGGNTLAKYGFLRATESARKEFKRPRMCEGSQEDQQQVQRQGRQQEEEEQAPYSQQQPSRAHAGMGDSLQAGRAGPYSAAAACPGRQKQAFLKTLQVAEPAQPLPVCAAGPGACEEAARELRHAAQQPAAALPVRAGISGLMAKLRADLREPGLDELLQQRACSMGGTAGIAAASLGSPGGLGAQLQSPADLGLQPSPTIDDLIGGIGAKLPMEPIPDSPEQDSLGAAPTQLQPEQQITPGFYGVSESEEQMGCMLAEQLVGGAPGLGLDEQEAQVQDPAAAEGEAAGDSISSLQHVHAFAQEAKAAVDRVAVQALRDSGMAGIASLRVLPPAYLQSRQQQQMSSAAALKRPFSVPWAAGDINKENGAIPAGRKRSRPGPPQQSPPNNLFSRFACK